MAGAGRISLNVRGTAGHIRPPLSISFKAALVNVDYCCTAGSCFCILPEKTASTVAHKRGDQGLLKRNTFRLQVKEISELIYVLSVAQEEKKTNNNTYSLLQIFQ